MGRTKTSEAIDLYAALGTVIRCRRTAVFLTQSHIADGAGITRSQMSNVELGRSGVTLHTLENIARVLHCKMWEILKDIEED